jgi:DNA-binding protein HU-beta
MISLPPNRFSFVTNHFLNSVVHSALFGGKTSWRWSDEAKKPTAAAKAKGPVTLKRLAAVLAEEHQLTKRAGQALLGDLVGIITKHLKKRERVRIAGLGILQIKKSRSRMGRNPETGEVIKINANKKVAFRAAKDLKMAV